MPPAGRFPPTLLTRPGTSGTNAACRHTRQCRPGMSPRLRGGGLRVGTRRARHRATRTALSGTSACSSVMMSGPGRGLQAPAGPKAPPEVTVDSVPFGEVEVHREPTEVDLHGGPRGCPPAGSEGEAAHAARRGSGAPDWRAGLTGGRGRLADRCAASSIIAGRVLLAPCYRCHHGWVAASRVARRRSLPITFLLFSILCVTGLTSCSNSPAAAATVWLCRPGLAHDPCTASLETTVVNGTGSKRVVDYEPASHPAIDCFYVYPLVSLQTTPNATLRIDRQETAIAELEASPFSRVCRVFAPMAQQVAYDSVLSAWRDYLAHYNDCGALSLSGIPRAPTNSTSSSPGRSTIMP